MEQMTPMPAFDISLNDREQAEKFLRGIEELRGYQQIMQKGAAKVYGIERKTAAAWASYNAKMTELAAAANNGELNEAELVQLRQFQNLTPPEFLKAITTIFDNLSLLAQGIYGLDAATSGEWIGVYSPQDVPEEDEPL